MANYKQEWKTDEEQQEYDKLSLDFDKNISPQLTEEPIIKKPKSLEITPSSVLDDAGEVIKSITPISFIQALLEGKSIEEAGNKAKWDYNKNVAQVIRDGWGIDDKVQNKGAWYQPDEVIDPETGAMQRTGNKYINDFSDEELAYLTQQYAQESGDDTYYEMYNPTDNLEKKGYSSERHGIYDRYKNDPNFRDWIVTKNKKTKNADFIERIQHGQRNNMDARLVNKENYDDYEGLIAGRTEVYKLPSHELFNTQTVGGKDNKLFGKEKTGTSETNVQTTATAIAKDELDNDQIVMANNVRNLTSKDKPIAERALTGDTETYNRDKLMTTDTDKLSTEDLIKHGHKVDEDNDGTMGWKGAFTEDVLATKPQFQKVAEDLGTRLFGISKDLSPEQQAKEFMKSMSAMNWNISTLVSRGLDINSMEPEMAKQMADSLELYNMTDTSGEQIWRGLKEVVTKDPTTWATAGISNVPKTVSKKAAMNQVIKAFRNRALGVKNPMKHMKGTFASKFTQNQAKLAAVEGGVYGGVDNGVKQTFKMKGRDEEFNAKEFLTSAAIGTVAGFGLGGLMSGRKNGEIPEFAPKEVNAEIKKLGDVLRDPNSTGKDKRVAKKTMRDLMDLKTMLKGTDDVDLQNEIKARAVNDFIEKGYLQIDSEQRIAEGIDDTLLKPDDYRTDIDGTERNVRRKKTLSKTTDDAEIDEKIDVKKNEIENLKNIESRQKNETVDTDITKLDTTNRDLAEIISLRESKAAIQSTVDSTGNQTQKQTDGMANYSRFIEKTIKKLEAEGYTRKEISEAMKTKKAADTVANIKKDKKPSFRITLDGDELKVYKTTSRKKSHYYYIDSEDTIRFDSKQSFRDVEDIKRVFPEKIKPKKNKRKIPTNEKRIPESQEIKETKFNEEHSQNAIIKVKDPVTTRGEEIKVGNKKIVPDVKQFEFEGKTDTVGRNYDKSNKSSSIQKGQSGVAQTEMVDTKIDTSSVKTTVDGLSARVKSFTEKLDKEAVSGQGTIKKSSKHKPKQLNPNERKAAITDYKLKEVRKLLADKDVLNSIKSGLNKTLLKLIDERKSIKNIGIKDAKMRKEINRMYDSQFKTTKDYDNSVRETETKDRYQSAKSNKAWKENVKFSPYGKASTAERKKMIGKVFKKWSTQRTSMEKDVAKAEEHIKLQLRDKGIVDDLNELPTQGVDMDKVALIQEYRDLTDDMMSLVNGKMTDGEAIYRHKDRSEKNIQDEISYLVNEGASLEKATQIIQKEYADTGVNVNPKVEEGDEYKSTGGKEDPEAKKIRQEMEKQNFEHKRKTEIEKLENYTDSTGKVLRKTATNLPKMGHEVIRKQQQDLLDARIEPEEIAKMDFPEGANKENIDELQKIQKEKVNTAVNDNRREELGINAGTKFLPKPHKLQITETMIDASNSMLQVMSVLTRSRKMGDYSKLTGGKLDIRVEIGKTIDAEGKIKLPKVSDGEGGYKNWKAIIKPLFMTENYGRGEKGLINSLISDNGISRVEAKQIHDAYQRAMEDIFPEIGIFKNIVNERMSKPELGGEIKWTLPDDKEVVLKITKEVDDTYKIANVNGTITRGIDSLNTASKALMPQYIQSYDAYIARMMRKKKYITNHDAFLIPKGKTEIDAHTDMAEILSDILKGDDYNRNMKEMGNKGRREDITKTDDPVQLTDVDIYNSPYKMEVEHGPSEKGGIETATERKLDNSSIKSDEQLMRDFMATSNFRGIDTHSMTDAIVDDIGANNTYAKAHENDDPFERMGAMAYQSNKYDASKEIPAPKGVDENTWYKTQRGIFYETRAKLEQNPETNYQLGGERIFYDMNGKPVGDNKLTRKEIEQMLREKDYKNRVEYNKKVQEVSKEARANIKRIKSEITALENSKGEVLISGLTNKEKKLVKTVGRNYGSMARKVKSWNPKKRMNKAESLSKTIVEQARKTESKTKSTASLQNKYNVFKWGPYFERQTNFEKPMYKQLQELQNLEKKYAKNVARYEENLLKVMQDYIPKDERTLWTKHLLDTDFAAISRMDKKTAIDFMKSYDDIYQKAKSEIKQAAKGLNRPEYQKGYYHNNAIGIAKKLNMSKEHVEIIDKLISIEAMTDDAWKFVESKQDNPNFKAIMEMIHENQRVSKEQLFKNNKESLIKGYARQIFNQNRTLDEDGNVIYKTEDYEKAALPVEREQLKRGTRLEENDAGKLITDEGQADRANLKIEGIEPMRIGGKKIREELGRSENFTEIMSSTIADTKMKLGRRTQVEEIKQGTFDTLFSKESKDGFVELTKQENRMLPTGLRDEIKFVNKDLKDMLIGRESVSFTKNRNQTWKVVDRMVRDLTTRFKKNNVLSNTTSHVNALGFNQSIGASTGVRPDNIVKWQGQALVDMHKLSKLWSTMAEAQARGNKELAKKTWNEIKEVPLYQYEMAGLATNAIDGIKQSPDIFREIIGSSFLGKSEKVNRITRNIFAESDGLVGKGFNHSFTAIDTSGRYMMIKQYMSEGMTMNDAARKANGLFGDMDQIAPVFIDFADKYPIAPFMKWFSAVAPMLLKSAKEKPVHAIMVGMIIYSIGMSSEDENSRKASGVRLDGMNPMQGTFDFLEQALWGQWDDLLNEYNRKSDTDEKLIRLLDKYVLPGFITKPLNSFMIKGIYDIEKYIYSPRSKNYEDIKGAPLNTKGKSQELMDEFMSTQYR